MAELAESVLIPQIGDFIAIAALTSKVIQALSSSRGSLHDHATLINMLQSLEQAMFLAETLCVEHHTSRSPEKSDSFEDRSHREFKRLQQLKDVVDRINQRGK